MSDSNTLQSDPEYSAAEFVATLELEDIPTAVREEATVLTADTLAAIIGGSTATEVAALATDQAEKNPGPASIHGTPHSATVGHASFVNGVAGSVLELNAGHKYAAGHPVIQLFPALVAEAEAIAADGTDFLCALVASYEVCTRAAIACEPLAPEYLPHGVWGGVGAAAAIARVRQFDTERTLTAMRLGANFAQHTSFKSTSHGATGVRNGSCGFSNLSGVVAADLAENGFSALESGIADHLDRATGEGFDAEVLGEKLGERWEIQRGYYKIHASGRLTHPAIDGAAVLQTEHGFDSSDIESITVETYEKAAKWDGTARPENRLQAKSSIPFGVATRLVHGESGKWTFQSEAITDELVDLMDTIEVVVDDELEQKVPDARSARVTVTLTDGRSVSTEIEHARGGEERPYSVSELHEKFDELVGPVLGSQRADDIWEAAQSLPETDPASLSQLGRDDS